jgi:hypothetical protein
VESRATDLGRGQGLQRRAQWRAAAEDQCGTLADQFQDRLRQVLHRQELHRHQRPKAAHLRPPSGRPVLRAAAEQPSFSGDPSWAGGRFRHCLLQPDHKDIQRADHVLHQRQAFQLPRVGTSRPGRPRRIQEGAKIRILRREHGHERDRAARHQQPRQCQR